MARDSAIRYSSAGSGEDAVKKAETSASATTDDTDDTISINSTPYASDDSQAEYSVEDILAQDDDIDGVMKYLVQWTGYPLEKCTWEPAENMGPDLLRDLWDKKRKKKSYQPFDLSLYYGAVARKKDRHLRRNLRRKKRGLPQTYPFLDEDVPATFCKPTTEAADVADGEAAGLGQETETLKTESTMAKTASTQFIDITQDSDDDAVAIEGLSTPAVARTKKKKKKKKNQDTAPRKGKEKEAPKSLSKKKSSAEMATSRPPEKLSAVPTHSSATVGRPKQSEKRLSTGGAKKPAGSSPVLKNSGVAARRLPEKNALAPLEDETNSPPRPPLAKTTSASSKAGPSATSRDARSSKLFSARKTTKDTQDIGNAFNSGKKIRTRQNLIAAMSDLSKPQQLFKSRRTLRIAELQERDKPDGIIEASKLTAQLFPISKGPPGVSSSSVNTANRRSSLPIDPPLTCGPAPLPHAPKQKKTVRFSGIGDDDGSVVTRVKLISPPAGGTEPCDDNDMVFHQEPARDRLKMPERAIKLFIGAQKDLLAVVFSVTAYEDGTQTMLDEVFGDNLLRLNYSCLADTLLHQLGGIRNKLLFSGSIVADPSILSGGERLDTIYQRLRTMAAGLIFLNTAYAILLYPTQCKDWSEQRFGFPIPAPDETSSALRYVAFSTYFDASSLLRPPQSAANDYEIPSELNEREYLMRIFSDLDRNSFTRLFPQRDKTIQRSAFLAFPSSASAFMQQLAFWIRDMDPSCAVLYSTTPGAWMAFCEKVSTGSGDGAVIVHEQVTNALRRFPGLNSLLVAEKGACRFWSFSQSILSPPLFPLVELHGGSEPDDNSQSDLGRVTWTQLFPSGLAVFITPSFVLSEPQRTQDLLRWVLKAHQAGNILITLVAAWDICGYLLKLADEKMRFRDEVKEDKSLDTKAQRQDARFRAGANPQMCHLRYEIYLLASEICDVRETAYFCPIEYADEAIDGDDEQSLVNWFGWWASLHVDQYRLFHVVGSDRELRSKSSGFAARSIRVPSFTPDTVADPDVAWERMQNAPVRSSADDGPSQGHTPGRDASIAHAVLTSPAPQSQLFPDASPGDFTVHLMDYSYVEAEAFWRMYGFAVYWKNADESFKHGTLQPGQFSIESWFNFMWPFSFKKIRTYIGFFNMLSDSYDDVPARLERRPRRHPFVVIYRPVRPHLPSYKQTQLIFWDFRAKSKFRDQDVIYKDDLTSAQRAVVDYVQRHGFEKHKMHLNHVLIGGEPFKTGWQTPVLSRRRSSVPSPALVSPNGNELDATMEYIDALASDIKNAIPAVDYYLEARGFKTVDMDNKRPSDQRAPTRQRSPEEANVGGGSVDSEQTKLDDDVKIVFHAPRGERKRHIGSSKCRNDFYESARRARARDPRQPVMEYEFRPTMEWYRDQIEEGRDYEHVHVGSWKSFFRTFGVGKGDTDLHVCP